ncbi:MAG: hypothetical protein ACOYB8_06490 [Eubacteriaceae bacterium]|jgi:hypothetical protein
MSYSISLICTILLATTSILAVFISVRTLKQNEKQIEEASRPYVIPYLVDIRPIKNRHYYYVIKNFGNSGAHILNISVDPPFKSFDNFHSDVFESFSNTFIAPGQSYVTLFSRSSNDNPYKVKRRLFTVEYLSSGGKRYCDQVVVNELAAQKLIAADSMPEQNESMEELIARISQEYFRQSM